MQEDKQLPALTVLPAPRGAEPWPSLHPAVLLLLLRAACTRACPAAPRGPGNTAPAETAAGHEPSAGAGPVRKARGRAAAGPGPTGTTPSLLGTAECAQIKVTPCGVYTLAFETITTFQPFPVAGCLCTKYLGWF